MAFAQSIRFGVVSDGFRAHAGRMLLPVLLAFAAAIPGAETRAEDGILTWIVQSISSDDEGDIIPASAMQVPPVGEALAAGQRISTGSGDHMVLVNGRDLVAIGPNTTLTIGDNDPGTPEANLDLMSGTVHVEVGKRAPGQTFSVGAPYLVATVKGTQFDVTTSSEQSTVAVTEGVVAVSSAITGQSVDVTAGNSAAVSRRNPGAPSLAPTPTSGASGLTGPEDNVDSSDQDNGGDSADAGGASDNSGSGSDSASSSDGSSGSSGSASDSGSASGSDSGSGSTGGSTGGLGDAVGDATGAVGGAVGDATGAVGDAVGGATGAVGDAVGGVAGAVGDTVGGDLGDTVGSVGGAVGDTVGRVGGAVGDTVGDVGGAVGGAVGGLGGAVGGALGGLGGR